MCTSHFPGDFDMRPRDSKTGGADRASEQGSTSTGGRDSSAPLRVVIADDHAPTRAGIRLALAGEGFSVCAEAADGGRAIEAARRCEPDVCLLDVHMPGGGIEACAAITSERPETKVVMLSASHSDDDVFAALQAGASGYLLKGMDPLRLAAALRGVIEGEAALPRTLVARLIDEFRARGRAQTEGLVRPGENDLTSREWEVLDLMREGLRTREIAERLFISDTTVRRHVGAILKKLRVSDREAAVRLVESDGRLDRE
jgi:DNA-binding NarL/FixJ family response regulator